jgi:hypothetical protein
MIFSGVVKVGGGIRVFVSYRVAMFATKHPGAFFATQCRESFLRAIQERSLRRSVARVFFRAIQRRLLPAASRVLFTSDPGAFFATQCRERFLRAIQERSLRHSVARVFFRAIQERSLRRSVASAFYER